MLGILVKGDATEGDAVGDRAKDLIKPWHYDACTHYQGPCDCAPGQYDIASFVGAVDIMGGPMRCIDVTGLDSYVNTHGEWYDAVDCTDFDQVVRAGMERVAGQCEYTMVLLSIHYVGFGALNRPR